MQELERPTEMKGTRSIFDHFAENSSRLVGQALFFTIALVVVIVWMPLVVVFESVDTWQLVLNTLTSVIAFLLIALLQNSERRNDRALHRKLDTIAIALAAGMRNQVEGDAEGLRRGIAELEAAIKLEEQI